MPPVYLGYYITAIKQTQEYQYWRRPQITSDSICCVFSPFNYDSLVTIDMAPFMDLINALFLSSSRPKRL